MRLPRPRSLALVLAGLLLGGAAVPGLAQPWRVTGDSMSPAILDGSLLLVDAVGPRLTGYRPGDVVVFEVTPAARHGSRWLVKRIVAVAGDRVTIAGGSVHVNGERLVEPYLPAAARVTGRTPLDVVVPAGAVFVLGDRRWNSWDSGSFGPVRLDRLQGRAWLSLGPGGAASPGGHPSVEAGAP